MKLAIDDIKFKKEKQIQETIFNCLKNNKSFCFDAGAGAGKTYSLIASLEFIIQKKLLNSFSQKVLCITYTNAAKNEMEERLGVNEQIIISTIHEFIWNLISIQQPALLELHKRNIIKNIEKYKEDLEATFFDSFSESDKQIFKEIIYDATFKEKYNNAYSLKAKEFKDEIESFFIPHFDFLYISKNVINLKKVISVLNNKAKLEQTLVEIEEGLHKKVNYNSSSNRDYLANMEFSHDTLLEYAKKMITDLDDLNFNILKKTIIDKYPFILIDEYQDTSPDIVKIMFELESYSTRVNKKFLVGYFGDSVQSIFSHGVGERVDSIHLSLTKIRKEFNRRSSQSVINVINNIRNDQIEQVSIYSDNHIGHASVVVRDFSNEIFIKEYIDQYYKKNKGTVDKEKNNNFITLSLKHEILGKVLDFSNLDKLVRKSPRYNSGLGFEKISTEFLGNSDRNLGYFFRMLKRLFYFIDVIKYPETTISEINSYLKKNNNKLNVSFERFKNFINRIKKDKSDNLEEMLIFLIEEANKEKLVGILLENIFKFNSDKCISISDIRNIAVDFFKIETDEENDLVEAFFSLSLKEFENWYNYISMNFSSEMNYITCHSSKGLEFNDVLIIYNNRFMRRTQYMEDFFTNTQGNFSEAEEKKVKDWKETRNLLYVACSRAKKNLVMLVDKSELSSELKSGFEKLGFEIDEFE